MNSEAGVLSVSTLPPFGEKRERKKKKHPKILKNILEGEEKKKKKKIMHIGDTKIFKGTLTAKSDAGRGELNRNKIYKDTVL